MSEFCGPFVINTPREDDVAFTIDDVPFGANMAFRTEILKHSKFDPRLGRQGPTLLGNDDTTKIRQLLMKGHLGRWVPGAKVQHFVVSTRLNRRYIHRFISGHQQTAVLVHGTDGRGCNRFPWWALRMYLESAFRQLFGFVADEELWYRGMRMTAYAEGTIIGCLRRWKEKC